jgi:hypothetical protein
MSESRSSAARGFTILWGGFDSETVAKFDAWSRERVELAEVSGRRWVYRDPKHDGPARGASTSAWDHADHYYADKHKGFYWTSIASRARRTCSVSVGGEVEEGFF